MYIGQSENRNSYDQAQLILIKAIDYLSQLDGFSLEIASEKVLSTAGDAKSSTEAIVLLKRRWPFLPGLKG